MYYACGNNFAWFPIRNANIARQLSTVDTQLREFQPEVLGLRPLGDIRPYDAFKQLFIAPWFQMLTRNWLRASLAAILYANEDFVDKYFEKMDAFVGPSSSISPIRGKNQGIYLDGAWADNPPLSEMVGEEESDRPVHSLHEFWIVEYFPKYDANIPSTPLERQRRRDELWQNSLVEHEKKEIGQKQEQAAQKNKQEAIKPCVRRIAHNFPIEPKASMVNNPLFLKTMMSHGYAAASCFVDNLD